jgi:hypothetical protein
MSSHSLLFSGLSSLPPIVEAFSTHSSEQVDDTDASLDIELISQLRGSRTILEEDVIAQEENGMASFDVESLAQYHALVKRGEIESIGTSPTALEAEEAVEKYLERFWKKKLETAQASLKQEDTEGIEQERLSLMNSLSDCSNDRFVTVRNQTEIIVKDVNENVSDDQDFVEDSRDQLGNLWDAASPLRSPFSSLPQYLGSPDKRDLGTEREMSSSPFPVSSPHTMNDERDTRYGSSGSPTAGLNSGIVDGIQQARKPPSSKRAAIVSSRIAVQQEQGFRTFGSYDDAVVADDNDISSPLERVAHNLLHLLIDEGPVGDGVVGGEGEGGTNVTVNDSDVPSNYFKQDDDKVNTSGVVSAAPPGASPLDLVNLKILGGTDMTNTKTELQNSTSLAFDPIFASLKTPDARADYSRIMRKGRVVEEVHTDPKPVQQTPV